METLVVIELALEPGKIEVKTEYGMLDHFLNTLAKHAGWTLIFRAEGDRTEDKHHLTEDVAIALGQAFGKALGERKLARFGHALVPMDEVLVRGAVDLADRAFFSSNMADPLFHHFMRSFAFAVPMTLHLDVLKQGEPHHETEACFKTLALCLKQATRPAEEFPTVK